MHSLDICRFGNTDICQFRASETGWILRIFIKFSVGIYVEAESAN